jgi:hypothetical protein
MRRKTMRAARAHCKCMSSRFPLACNPHYNAASFHALRGRCRERGAADHQGGLRGGPAQDAGEYSTLSWHVRCPSLNAHGVGRAPSGRRTSGSSRSGSPSSARNEGNEASSLFTVDHSLTGRPVRSLVAPSAQDSEVLQVGSYRGVSGSGCVHVRSVDAR